MGKAIQRNAGIWIILGALSVFLITGIFTFVRYLDREAAKESRVEYDEVVEKIPEEEPEESEFVMEAKAQAPAEPVLSKEEEMAQRIDGIIAGMTDEEKAAQLFFVTPEQLTRVGAAVEAGDTTRRMLNEYPVGGLIYSARNMKDPVQAKKLLTDTQAIMRERSGFPVFMGIDEEGGRVVRIADNAAFGVSNPGSSKSLAESGASAYGAGSYIGGYLKRFGFNLDFAPVADVLTDPSNSVIGDRSYGSDAAKVSQMAGDFARGLKDAGIISVYKHFPGHGGVTADTHTGAAVSQKTLEELTADELVPFADAAAAGADMIMVSFVAYPKVTSENTPAALSHLITTGLLRNRLGYDGVVITDALNMGAVTGTYTSGDAAILALQAGCDMLLMPGDFDAAYSAVLEGIRTGTLTKERIEESLQRILKLKLEKTEE